MPFAHLAAKVRSHPPVDLRRVPLKLSPYDRMIRRYAALIHQLLRVAIGEPFRLRVKYLDLAPGEILARDGKGEKDHRTILPRPLSKPLGRYLERVR